MKEGYFKINNRKIGHGQPVFIIAEMSANHNQNFERAKKLIKIAAKAGVDAVKVQTYTPDTLTIDCAEPSLVIKSYNSDWDKKTLYNLYKKAYMPWEWQPKLKKIAEELGIIFFSTAYDETSVDFLESIDIPAYKIASFELIDTGLLKKVAKTKKPIVISKGMASLKEIEKAISTLRKNGARDIALLHCVSRYPAKSEDMNISTIQDMGKRFKIIPGLSDHTLGISVSIAAVALGARVIEKHFTLDRADGGPDSSFSLEPNELNLLVSSIREAEKAIGKIQYGPTKQESAELNGRRSLFAVKDIKKDERFTKENIRSIRPGFGLAPEFLPQVLRKKAGKNIKRGTPLDWNLIVGK